jgi:hypothetical protein
VSLDLSLTQTTVKPAIVGTDLGRGAVRRPLCEPSLVGSSIIEPAEGLAPGFEQYRDRIASVETEDAQPVGLLVTYVVPVDRLIGFRWLRPRWRPSQGLMGWFMPTDGRADEVYGLTVEELEEGRWSQWRLRWLNGRERQEAWEQYLREWGPHDSLDYESQAGPDL